MNKKTQQRDTHFNREFTETESTELIKKTIIKVLKIQSKIYLNIFRLKRKIKKNNNNNIVLKKSEKQQV